MPDAVFIVESGISCLSVRLDWGRSMRVLNEEVLPAQEHEEQVQAGQRNKLLGRVPVQAITWFWLILGLGALLRLATLNRQSLWLDEAYSFWMSNRPWQDIVASLPSADTHPPLHYLVLQPMIALGGSEWLLRLPSALAGIVSIFLLYALGAELFNRQTGLLAALILAISPLHIWYAQEARMYALVAVLALAAGLFAARALRTNHPVDWILLGVCQGLALWTNSGAVWFTLALNTAALLIVVALWQSRRFWPWVASQLLALAIFSPWLPAFHQQMQSNHARGIPPATIHQALLTLGDFVDSFARPQPEVLLALLVLVIGLAVGARSLLREALVHRARYVLLGCWFVVPVGLSFLVSQPYVHLPLLSAVLGPRHSIFATRNLIIASFPLYLLLARSLQLGKRPLSAVVLVVLVVLGAVAYRGNNLQEQKDDYRAAAKIVAAHALPRDLIVFAPNYLELPFLYYSDRSNGAGVRMEELEDGVIAEGKPHPYASPAAALPYYHRVWLITWSYNPYYYRDHMGTVPAVKAMGRLLKSQQVQGLRVQLYDIGKGA